MGTTHAEVASNLLKEAAAFFINLGNENEQIAAQMNENARVFTQMADLLDHSPAGTIDGQTHGQMAGKLMEDAANFFMALGEQNEPIKEQMDQNADIYKQIGSLVGTDPLGTMD